jgi:hypothetical protein
LRDHELGIGSIVTDPDATGRRKYDDGSKFNGTFKKEIGIEGVLDGVFPPIDGLVFAGAKIGTIFVVRGDLFGLGSSENINIHQFTKIIVILINEI